MFKSRKKRDFSFYIKELFWPSMGWKRAAQYLAVRAMRLSATSDSVPRGFACGVTASFFPIFGTHAILGVALAFLARANIVAAALGSLVIPPVILPLLFSLDFLVGRKILNWIGHRVVTNENQYLRESADKGLQLMVDNFDRFFAPAFVGSLVFMVLVWPATYMAAHKVIELIRRHYRDKKKV